MQWVFLFSAIFLEVCGTLSLKASNEFTNRYGFLVVLFYMASFYCLSKAVSYINISVAYAIWSGVGIVSLAVVGHFFMKERLDAMSYVFVLMILVATVGLQLRSSAHG